LEVSGPGYYGFPIENYAPTSATAAADRVYDVYEIGARMTVPSNVKMNIIGIGACFVKTGAPTHDLRFRLYTGADGAEALTATTSSIPRQSISTGIGCVAAYLPSVYTASGGSVIRPMLSASAAGDTNNLYYNLSVGTIENDANSKALVFSGAMYYAKHDNSGAANANWTYTDTKLVTMYVILDPSGRFTSAGGGSSAFVQ
jgi:hypothetical protein